MTEIGTLYGLVYRKPDGKLFEHVFKARIKLLVDLDGGKTIAAKSATARIINAKTKEFMR